ncbi:MAG: LapA family protein [Planctomycetota bacterium]
MTDPAKGESKPAATLGSRLKLAAVILSLIVVAIVVIQNTEQVETRILFMTITMPRAVLLFVTAALGFGAGLLMGVRRAQPGSDQRAAVSTRS